MALKEIELVERGVSVLLEALQGSSGSLADCSNDVRELIRQGTDAARMKQYDRALSKFDQAVALDKRNLPARLRAIKVLMGKGRNLQALVIGGFTLSLAENPTSRCQIYNFCGEIARDLFASTKERRYADQAVDFFADARDSDPQDLLPRANDVAVNLIAANAFSDTDDAVSAEFVVAAKQSFNDVVRLCTSGQGNSSKYLKDVLMELSPLVPKDAWWHGQMDILQECVANPTEAPEIEAKESTGGDRRSGIRESIYATRRKVLVGIVMLALAGAGAGIEKVITTAAPTGHATPADGSSAKPHPVYDLNTTSGAASLEVSVGHDYDDLQLTSYARGHDFDDLTGGRA